MVEGELGLRRLAALSCVFVGCSAGSVPAEHEAASTGTASAAAATSATAAPPASASVIAPVAPTPVGSMEPPKVLETNGVRVAAKPMPIELTPDGNLSEWGPLEGVAVAFDPNRVAIAGTIKGQTQAVYVALYGPNQGVPAVGEAQRGGGVRYYGCDTKPWSNDPLPAGEKQACLELEKANDRFAIAVQASFERVYRIDATGVHAIAANGKAKQIVAAKAHYASTAEQTAFEVELSAKEMPRLTEAPMTSIYFLVSPDRAPGPSDTSSVLLELPAPIGFEPDAKALAMVFDPATAIQWLEKPLLSYQPGEGGVIQEVGFKSWWNRETRMMRTHQAFQPVHKAKNFEVGWTFNGQKRAAVRRNSGDYSMLELGTLPVAVVARGADLHVIGLDSDTDMATQCYFGVAVVHPDGSHEALELEFSDDSLFSKPVKPFHSADYTSFGCEGPWAQDPKKNLKIVYRWDEKKKTYVLTRT